MSAPAVIDPSEVGSALVRTVEGAALPAGVLLMILAVLSAAVVLMVSVPAGGTRSLDVLGRLGPRRELAGPQEDAEQSFGSRVAGPVLAAALRLGRRLTPQGQLARLNRRLELAGSPPGWDSDRVVAMQVLAVLAALAVGGCLGYVLGLGAARTLVLLVFLVAAGWLGPPAYVSRLASQRSAQLLKELPDTLDMLTISVEAGLSFDAAVARVARSGTGPAAREFARLLQEIQIGTNRSDALRSLAERTDVEELQSLAAALIQAETFGVRMAKALRVQAQEIRVRRRQRAEEQAQRIPVKILFPLIFGILPVLFLVIMAPPLIESIGPLLSLTRR